MIHHPLAHQPLVLSDTIGRRASVAQCCVYSKCDSKKDLVSRFVCRILGNQRKPCDVDNNMEGFFADGINDIDHILPTLNEVTVFSSVLRFTRISPVAPSQATTKSFQTIGSEPLQGMERTGFCLARND
jgi:hypothetical protein